MEEEAFPVQLGAMPHKDPAVQEQLHRRGRGWAVTGDCPSAAEYGKELVGRRGWGGGLERPWEKNVWKVLHTTGLEPCLVGMHVIEGKAEAGKLL